MSDDLMETQTAVIPDGYKVLNWTRGFGRQIGPLYEKGGVDEPAVMGFRVEEHHVNGMFNCHGGMLMTFADIAWGRTVSLARSHWWVTVRLTCDFLTGAKLGDWVEGTSEMIAEQDQMFTVRGRVWSGERLLLTGTGVFKAIAQREVLPGDKGFRY